MKRLLCPYLVKYSPDVHKKKNNFLDNFYIDNKCFIKPFCFLLKNIRWIFNEILSKVSISFWLWLPNTDSWFDGIWSEGDGYISFHFITHILYKMNSWIKSTLIAFFEYIHELLPNRILRMGKSRCSLPPFLYQLKGISPSNNFSLIKLKYLLHFLE